MSAFFKIKFTLHDNSRKFQSDDISALSLIVEMYSVYCYVCRFLAGIVLRGTSSKKNDIELPYALRIAR